MDPFIIYFEVLVSSGQNSSFYNKYQWNLFKQLDYNNDSILISLYELRSLEYLIDTLS